MGLGWTCLEGLEPSISEQVRSGPLIVIDGQDLSQKDASKGCDSSHMTFGCLYKGCTTRDQGINQFREKPKAEAK